MAEREVLIFLWEKSLFLSWCSPGREALCLPSPVVLPPSLLGLRSFLFPPWCVSLEVVFSQPLGLWSFASPSPYWTLEFCVGFCCFLFSFFAFLWQEVDLEASGGEFCCCCLACGAFPSLICDASLMLDLRLSIGFWETRAIQMGPSACSGSIVLCCGHVGYWWPARGCHAPGTSFLWAVRDGHAPLLLAAQRWCPDSGRPICCLVASGEARVVHAPFFGDGSVPSGDLDWFLLDLFVFLLVSMYSLSMCGSNFIKIVFVMGA